MSKIEFNSWLWIQDFYHDLSHTPGSSTGTGKGGRNTPLCQVAASSEPVVCSKEPTWECLSSPACSKNTRGSNKIPPRYLQTRSLLNNTSFTSSGEILVKYAKVWHLTGNVIHWPSLSSWFSGSAGEILAQSSTWGTQVNGKCIILSSNTWFDGQEWFCLTIPGRGSD